MNKYQVLTAATFTEDINKKFLIYTNKENNENILLMEYNDFLTNGLIDLKPENLTHKSNRERELKINQIYKHYKDKDYLTLYKATDVKTGEEYTIYLALYDEFKIWARPLDMFLEKTIYNDKEVLRFEEKI